MTAPSEVLAQRLQNIARQFVGQDAVMDIQPLGNGNINDTFRVSLGAEDAPDFVLQRINTAVFQQPHQVMQNLCRMTEHVQHRLADSSLTQGRRWTMPRVIYTTEGQNCWQDETGGVWRSISFIDRSVTFDTIQSHEHAWEVGFGLGTFHRLINDLSPEQMVDTLEGFHITPNYLAAYEQLARNNSTTECPEVLLCREFIHQRTERVVVLEQAKHREELPIRLIHGDPKINNLLFDAETQQAISIIDLDTVKPGLIQYDIGDCLRSGCNPLGEETRDWQKVAFDVAVCEKILQGYCTAAKDFLTAVDYRYFYDAVWLIAFELGLRFFSDYIAGNTYFKVKYTRHNLIRALVQFKLVESIEHQRESILSIVESLANAFAKE